MRIVHPQVGEVSFEDLRRFICEGKKNGWASGKKPINFTDGSEGYKHVEGNLFYRDNYIGEGNFMGQEVVYFINGLPTRNIPLWGMSYSDSFKLPTDFPSDQAKPFEKEVMNFLKDCLMQVPEDFPFRGPNDQVIREVMGRELVYVNTPMALREHPSSNYIGGDFIFRGFHGFETIFMEPGNKNGSEIFNLVYHGRLLVPEAYVRD
ncbi:MAG: DUF5680 domain-containing protein [Nanoarchaeota archaeon]